MNPPFDPNDPTTWPVVECEPTDVFLGSFDHNCTPDLPPEQKTWPVVECEPSDVFVEPKTPTPPQPPSRP